MPTYQVTCSPEAAALIASTFNVPLTALEAPAAAGNPEGAPLVTWREVDGGWSTSDIPGVYVKALRSGVVGIEARAAGPEGTTGKPSVSFRPSGGRKSFDLLPGDVIDLVWVKKLEGVPAV